MALWDGSPHHWLGPVIPCCLMVAMDHPGIFQLENVGLSPGWTAPMGKKSPELEQCFIIISGGWDGLRELLALQVAPDSLSEFQNSHK